MRGIRSMLVIGGLVAGAMLSAPQGAAAQQQAKAARKAQRAQVANELLKLHQAQLIFFRRLASDDGYADQFDNSVGARDFGGARRAAALATGLSETQISVGDGVGVGGEEEALDGPILRASQGPSAGAMRLPRGMMKSSGKICFDFGVVQGCVEW
jgi:hypothetical protein